MAQVLRRLRGAVIPCAAVFLFAAISLAAGAARAEPLLGRVTAEGGGAAAGAIVTLSDLEGRSESVYSDSQGKWRLETRLKGGLSLRVRLPGFADSVVEVDLPAKAPFETVLHAQPNPQALSDSLVASAHAASLSWGDPKMRGDFVMQCQFCHQIGNEWTRRERPPELWRDIIRRMEGYGSLITGAEEREFEKTLSAGFKGKPLGAAHHPSFHPDLPKALVREWSFGGPLNYIHDVELAPDGLLYGVDMSMDKVWALDFATGVVTPFDLPPNGLPLGGMFSGGVAPLGTFGAYHGPHSIILGPDGLLYMTCSLSGEIGLFDPKTKQTKFLPLGGDAVYPHTLRFDKNGILWFTLALSNQIGRYDPKTGKFQILDTPANGFWRWMSDALLPSILEVSSWFGKKDLYITLSHHKSSGEGYRVLNLPYGIDINPVDGSIWYSKLYSDYIGRVDPKTLEIKEFKTPRVGPRRMRFDKEGNLWIPSFGEGYLEKFNTKTLSFEKEYRLPTLARNEYEIPYALAVHPQTGDIWVSANLSDRFLRFDPKTETFAAYPSPTRVTFVRDFIFLPNGDVCTSNSNLPAAAIEGGRPKIVCVSPGAFPDAK